MTYEEKLALAARIRSSNFIEPTYDPTYTAWGELCTRETVFIPVPGHKVTLKAYLTRAKEQKENAQLIINIHGGGFVRGHMPANTHFCSRLAAETGGVCLDLDYGLAPENPYPYALEECYAAAVWAFERAAQWGCDAENVAMVGHSAGASIVLANTMQALQTGDFRARLQVLDFGAFDMVTDPEKKRGVSVSVLSAERMRAFTTLYTDDNPEVLRSPFVSPVFAPDDMLRGLPETLILTAGNDPLRFEAEELGARMVGLNVPVTMQRFADSNHGFTVHCTGAWKEAQERILRTIRSLKI